MKTLHFDSYVTKFLRIGLGLGIGVYLYYTLIRWDRHHPYNVGVPGRTVEMGIV